MNTPTSLVVAIPAALLGALAFALTGVLQQRVTTSVHQRRALDPRLFWDLVRQPAWSLAILTNLFGLALQVLALHFAALIFVQPLLVSGLLFAVLISARLQHRPPDRVMIGGAVMAALGLAGFIVAARPQEGSGAGIHGRDVVYLVIGLGVAVGVALLLGWRTRGVSRAVALALGTGICYGVTAGLFKVLSDEFTQGLGAVFTNWTVYVVVVLGPMAFLLSQNAFQASPQVAPPLAVITTMDPLTGIAVGLLWLGESVRASAGAVTAEVLSLALMALGVYALAHRSPAVSQADSDRGPRSGAEAAATA